MPAVPNGAVAAYKASLASRYIFSDEQGNLHIDWESYMTSCANNPASTAQQAAKRSRQRGPVPEYEICPFYQLYVTDTKHMMRNDSPLFRYRFRLPTKAYYELLQDVKDEIRIKSEYFKRWQHAPLSQPEIPLELLVLGALRMLGSNTTLDQISEVTYISKDTMNAFFREFCRWGSEVFYKRHVRAPSTREELDEIVKVYTLGGFAGCCGSIDATHVKLLNYIQADYNLLKGKENYPSLAFMVAVTHTGRVMHVGKAFYGALNDKTMAGNDAFIDRLRRDELFTNYPFKLIDQQGKWHQYHGAYLLSDGGILNERCFMPPLSITTQPDEIEWLKQHNGLRKDVECYFGRAKRRFRMLWYGIRFRDYGLVEMCFRFVCALMNWLHDIDGLGDDCSAFNIYKEEINQDLVNVEPPEVDEEEEKKANEPEPDDPQGPPASNDLDVRMEAAAAKTMYGFRKKLIAHYAVGRAEGWVGWPKRRRPYEF